MKIQLVILQILVFTGFGMSAQTSTNEGWQFKSFIGDYRVIQSGGCSILSGAVSINYLNSKDYLSIKIRPRFSSDQITTEYLRNYSSHGEDCYECDPDRWDSTVIGGDGVKVATYKNVGVMPYTHKSYSTIIELERSEQNRIYIKFNECVAELEVM